MSSAVIHSLPNFRVGIRYRRGRSRVAAGHSGRRGAWMKEFDPFRLDTGNECLWRRDEQGAEERILIKPKAFAILRYLVEHAGRLATQEQLLNAVWPHTYVQPEVLKRHIGDIRNLLGDDPKHPAFIETRPWRGYQFIAAVRDVVSAEPGNASVSDSPAYPVSVREMRQPVISSAPDRRAERDPGPAECVAGDGDGDLTQPEDLRKTDIRKAINKLIQQRKDIDRAIADFERLALWSASRSGLEPTRGTRSATLFRMKPRPPR